MPVDLLGIMRVYKDVVTMQLIMPEERSGNGCIQARARAKIHLTKIVIDTVLKYVSCP